jgi:hypothetical protein
MANDINYEGDIRIDETALDIEWLDQSELALKYGRHYAECRYALTVAEEKIKVIRAELIEEANADPVKCCNKDKPNAADIEAYYRTHKRHKAAKEVWVEAQFECNMAEVAKNEFSFSRKASLENLVTLYVAGYFSGPKVSRNLIEEREARQKRVDEGVSAKINRIRK